MKDYPETLYDHPDGYCGNQLCCWGKYGDKVPKDKESI